MHHLSFRSDDQDKFVQYIVEGCQLAGVMPSKWIIWFQTKFASFTLFSDTDQFPLVSNPNVRLPQTRRIMIVDFFVLRGL